MEIAHVNLPVALLSIWLMIYPMMIQIDWSAVKSGQAPEGLWLTLVVNWLIKPFTMAAVGWLFSRVFFADWVSAPMMRSISGRHDFVGVAPCTAMVFVWSQLVKGGTRNTRWCRCR